VKLMTCFFLFYLCCARCFNLFRIILVFDDLPEGGQNCLILMFIKLEPNVFTLFSFILCFRVKEFDVGNFEYLKLFVM